MVEFNESLTEYIRKHRTAVLATNRKSGPPQLTLISYNFDGKDFAISTRGESVKAKNIVRRPDVCLGIIDGGQQLMVYGKARVVREPADVLNLTKGRLGGGRESEAELAERLQREGRVVIVLTPEHYFPERLRAP